MVCRMREREGKLWVRKRSQTKLIAVSLRHFCLAFCLSVLALHFCSSAHNRKIEEEYANTRWLRGGGGCKCAVVSMLLLLYGSCPNWLAEQSHRQTDRQSIPIWKSRHLTGTSQQQVQSSSPARVYPVNLKELSFYYTKELQLVICVLEKQFYYII